MAPNNTKSLDIQIAVLETKFEQVEKTLEEVKEDCQETKESLIALTPKIDALIATVNEIKDKKPESGDWFGFIKSNYKMLIVVFTVIKGIDFTGAEIVDLIKDDTSAASAQTEESKETENGK